MVAHQLGPAIAMLAVVPEDRRSESPDPQAGRPEEAPTRPTESPTVRIREALVEAICDGPFRPFSDEAIAAQRAASERLRQLVHDYVGHLRARGTPPERAVGFMKALIHDTVIPCGRPLLTLENQIMHWCIDAYYEEQK
jgi:hypothetical protein